MTDRIYENQWGTITVKAPRRGFFATASRCSDPPVTVRVRVFWKERFVSFRLGPWIYAVGWDDGTPLEIGSVTILGEHATEAPR